MQFQFAVLHLLMLMRNAIESDNDNVGGCATPNTQATLTNLTIVGGSSALPGTLNGARFRRQSGLILA